MEVSGQLHAPAALPPGKEPLVPIMIGVWVGPRAVLDMVVKRKIPSPCWESNPRTPITHPVAQHYTDMIYRIYDDTEQCRWSKELLLNWPLKGI
jgi:hypothetical protein